jgi:anti-anti-sigma factor
MEFLVEFEITVPDGTPPAEVTDRVHAEASTATSAVDSEAVNSGANGSFIYRSVSPRKLVEAKLVEAHGDSESFRIEASRGTGTDVIRLIGELDIAYVDAVQEAVTRAAAPTVVLELSALRFIDAEGLSALVVAQSKINGEGRVCVLRGAKGIVLRMFEITKLDDLLEDCRELR